MTSARFCACGKPAKVILVPAAKCCGSSSQSLSNSGVPFLALVLAQRVGERKAAAILGYRSADDAPQIRPDLVRAALGEIVAGLAHRGRAARPFSGRPWPRAGRSAAVRAPPAPPPPRSGQARRRRRTTNTGFSSGFGCTSMLDRIPATIATISAVRTEAMILFHSNDDIGAPFRPCRGRAENRIPPDNSNELSRFRRSHEPGILSLPQSPEPEHRGPRRTAETRSS